MGIKRNSVFTPPKAKLGHPMDALAPEPRPVTAPPVTAPPAAEEPALPAPKKAADRFAQVQLNARIRRHLRDQVAGTLRYMGPHDDAPHTMQEFTEAAFKMYLEHLAKRYNGGEPFPASAEPVTPGRKPSVG